MSIEIVRGTSSKPVASQELVQRLQQHPSLSGLLYIGYPIISTPQGRHSIDALLISPEKGLVVFDIIEANSVVDYDDRQDDSATKLEARLKTHSELTRRRKLLIPIYTISFAPGISNVTPHIVPDYSLANTSSLIETIDKFYWDGQDEVFRKTVSALQSISTIRQSAIRRNIRQEHSRGGKLRSLEASIATLDSKQSKAVIETVEGVQRIRGLAGSGKTIVLALKAAYLHTQHPDWRIGITFNTRSLKGQFRRLIERFTVEQTGDEPDWENLRIVSAWGASGDRERDGIYYEFCRINDVQYLDYRAARDKFGPENEFAGACEQALREVPNHKQSYDAILVDEAQDFSPTFLRLCHSLLMSPKRLVYAYDELQSLSGGSLASPEEIFGEHAPGVFTGDMGEEERRHDITLERCYRNSLPVLVTAHAFGFGIYREPQGQESTGLIQMFDHPYLWHEIGYRTREGELADGSPVTLYRPEDASPGFLHAHSNIDDLIQFICFDSEEDQNIWVANAIKTNLEDDELRHDDIVVINPDPRTTRNKVGPIRSRLFKMNIQSHTAGVDTSPDTFFHSDSASVTFTGVFRAKGNEAGMVYVINAHDCHSSFGNLATIRNRLFTSITRSKAWVRVLGIGDKMRALKHEYDRLKECEFRLQFIYPTAQHRERLRIVHRDMTRSEQSQIRNRQKVMAELVDELESNTLHIEDLDDHTVQRLKKILGKSNRRHAKPKSDPNTNQ